MHIYIYAYIYIHIYIYVCIRRVQRSSHAILILNFFWWFVLSTIWCVIMYICIVGVRANDDECLDVSHVLSSRVRARAHVRVLSWWHFLNVRMWLLHMCEMTLSLMYTTCCIYMQNLFCSYTHPDSFVCVSLLIDPCVRHDLIQMCCRTNSWVCCVLFVRDVMSTSFVVSVGDTHDSFTRVSCRVYMFFMFYVCFLIYVCFLRDVMSTCIVVSVVDTHDSFIRVSCWIYVRFMVYVCFMIDLSFMIYVCFMCVSWPIQVSSMT